MRVVRNRTVSPPADWHLSEFANRGLSVPDGYRAPQTAVCLFGSGHIPPGSSGRHVSAPTPRACVTPLSDRRRRSEQGGTRFRRFPASCRVVDPARDEAVGPAQAGWSNSGTRTPGTSSQRQNGVTDRRDDHYSKLFYDAALRNGAVGVEAPPTEPGRPQLGSRRSDRPASQSNSPPRQQSHTLLLLAGIRPALHSRAAGLLSSIYLLCSACRYLASVPTYNATQLHCGSLQVER